jgi:hypothetical protein
MTVQFVLQVGVPQRRSVSVGALERRSVVHWGGGSLGRRDVHGQ